MLYGRGYVNNGPSGRYVFVSFPYSSLVMLSCSPCSNGFNSGAGHSLVDIVLKLMSIYTVVKLITAA